MEDDSPNSSNSFPKFSEFIRLLEERLQVLSMVVSERKVEKRPAFTPRSGSEVCKIFHATPIVRQISFLSVLFAPECTIFPGVTRLEKKNPHEILAIVKRLQPYFNRLSLYRVNTSTSCECCGICKGKHDSLLHLQQAGNSQQSSSNA